VPKTSSLFDEVAGSVATITKSRNWFAYLPPDAQSDLERIRELYDPSAHIKRHYARAIIDACVRRGWSMPKERQVVEWLDARSPTKS